jgi:sugar/nucleoside kinase (ribokinase family)
VITAVSMGDIMLDTVIAPLGVDVTSSEAWIGAQYGQITTSPGGNGVFFAQAASSVGFAAILVGAVGGRDGEPDTAGKLILTALREAGVHCEVQISSQDHTGLSVILYADNDRRLLVADRGANAYLKIDEEGMTRVLHDTHLLHISCYMALNAPQRSRLFATFKLARSLETQIAIDLAPHDLVERIGAEATLQLAREADFLSSEVTTLGAAIAPWEPFVDLSVLDIHTVIRDTLGSRVSVLVRLNNASDFVWSRPDGVETFRVDYSEGLASLRFTDTVFARRILRSLNEY